MDCGARVRQGWLHVHYPCGSKYHTKTNKPKELEVRYMNDENEDFFIEGDLEMVAIAILCAIVAAVFYFWR
jgi:hypothetical protein